MDVRIAELVAVGLELGPQKTLDEVLQEAGIHVLPVDSSLPGGEDLARLEREIEEWSEALRPEDGLAGAILANRAEEDERT